MISIIIPAHNEGPVIARSLRAMTDCAELGELDVIVVCNGCSDNTATVARGFGSPVRVIETDVAGKTHALNLGDRAAFGFPRVYADADVVIRIDSIRKLAARLQQGNILAVAPTPEFDFSGCSCAVRACFDVRSSLPSANHGIGGSGVYALSEVGRRRFAEFPAMTADDGFVRIHFLQEEREMLADARSLVFPPKRMKDLIATKVRAHYGLFELASKYPELWKNNGERNHRSLLRMFKDVRLWPKLAIYSFVTIVAKRRALSRLRNKAITWERDNTSRALRGLDQ